MREAIETISKRLSLPFSGVEQDWEIESANAERVNEFVNFYQSSKLLLEEKKVLMSLIFASYNEYLDVYDVDRDQLWLEIVILVQSDNDIFKELINYWSLEGEVYPHNFFKITPLVRNISN